MSAETLAAAFTEAYQRPPEAVWRAPAEAALLEAPGDGLSLLFALPFGACAAAARRDDGVLEVRSLQAADAAPVLLPGGDAPSWAAGLAESLRALDAGGASLLLDSEILPRAGLGAARALRAALASAVCDLYDVAPALGPVPSRAEPGHVLLHDARSGLTGRLPFDAAGAGLALLVIGTGVSPGRDAAAARAATLAKALASLGLASPREVTDLPAALAALPDPALRGAVQHAVTEHHRVEAAAGLLRAGAVAELGAMLTASQMSLRDSCGASWPEADAALDAAVRAGARGGRLIGPGSGGCVLVLAAADRLPTVRDAVKATYTRRSWPPPVFLDGTPSTAAHPIP
ncbi:galactokinase [Actinomadura sp. PM05-2]|uniref:Galactokinase n=1 Tax=Actinomadura parmotrematis TaxID=2864039 RepID=A0ABS7G2G9_9ACTN|nr:galactokinase [Actinomadura parmotrematis]